jgi:ethanolamine-phosphate cytidylyltransferase
LILKEPKRLRKFKLVDSGNSLSTIDIVDRIISNSLKFSLRNAKKEKKELDLNKKFNLINGEKTKRKIK